MHLPRYLRINSTTLLRVEIVEPEEITDNHGEYEHSQHLIKINKADCTAVQRRTMIHEAFHAYCQATGLVPDAEEQEVMAGIVEGFVPALIGENHLSWTKFFTKPDEVVRFLI